MANQKRKEKEKNERKRRRLVDGEAKELVEPTRLIRQSKIIVENWTIEDRKGKKRERRQKRKEKHIKKKEKGKRKRHREKGRE